EVERSAAILAVVGLQFVERDLAIVVGVEGRDRRGRKAAEQPTAEEQGRRRHALGLLLAQDAVAVAVEALEQGLHEIVPRGGERLAVEPDVRPNQDGPRVAE